MTHVRLGGRGWTIVNRELIKLQASWHSEFGRSAGTCEPTDMSKYISFMLPNNLDSLACRSE